MVNVSGRIHQLHLTDDVRRSVDLTTFGFYTGGKLDVQMSNFQLPEGAVTAQYGFTIQLTRNDAMNLEPYIDKCYLDDNENKISSLYPAIIILRMDFAKLRLNVTCKGEQGLHLHLLLNRTKIYEDEYYNERKYTNVCTSPELPIFKETRNGFDYYNTSFAMYVATDREQGLYNIFFHSCPQHKGAQLPSMNAKFEIYESNTNNFLSAGEMPLPALYTIMSFVFFVSAALWTFILKTSRHPVYRIHILMCILVYLKALSLAFHGINYHFIKIRGEHVTAWAILFYITHLLKGAVLFVTIVLVGTGWNFIKHILSDRDKKLFMIVIPLQVVANVAEIIIAESEVGDEVYYASREMFILIDFLCCGAILIPVVGSIRHLEDASNTDGKAAINLQKLKLFRHFYIMVICYIYFTRFIVYVLKISVAFQYSWIDELFREMATYIFFALTGYKFRPAAANPYFQTSQETEVQSAVLSEIGVCQSVTKLSHKGERKSEDMQPLMSERRLSFDSD